MIRIVFEEPEGGVIVVKLTHSDVSEEDEYGNVWFWNLRFSRYYLCCKNFLFSFQRIFVFFSLICKERLLD